MTMNTAFNNSSHYWENGAWMSHKTNTVWRGHADWVNNRLLKRWLTAKPQGAVLKTDLYEEAVGLGQLPWLAQNFAQVQGIDVSPDVVKKAKAEHIGLSAVVGDVRELPFPNNSFEAVVSLSTLDHFTDKGALLESIAEVSRVLKPGGSLVLTLDNPANPIIGLRQMLPHSVVQTGGIVPYYCGATLHPSEFESVLSGAGLVMRNRTAILHCPRLLCVPVSQLLDHPGKSPETRRITRVLRGFERLESWPTRFRTGHFTAALCQKNG